MGEHRERGERGGGLLFDGRVRARMVGVPRWGVKCGDVELVRGLPGGVGPRATTPINRLAAAPGDVIDGMAPVAYAPFRSSPEPTQSPYACPVPRHVFAWGLRCRRSVTQPALYRDAQGKTIELRGMGFLGGEHAPICQICGLREMQVDQQRYRGATPICRRFRNN
jgi:hypothetical protein